MPLDTEAIKKWTKLANVKEALEFKLAQINKQMGDIEGPILENMATAETDSVKINGRTVFVHTSYYAEVSSRAAAKDALKKAGYDHLVAENYNANSLSALVREFRNEGKDLPEAFTGVIKIGERNNLRSRKA